MVLKCQYNILQKTITKEVSALGKNISILITVTLKKVIFLVTLNINPIKFITWGPGLQEPFSFQGDNNISQVKVLYFT